MNIIIKIVVKCNAGYSTTFIFNRQINIATTTAHKHWLTRIIGKYITTGTAAVIRINGYCITPILLNSIIKARNIKSYGFCISRCFVEVNRSNLNCIRQLCSRLNIIVEWIFVALHIACLWKICFTVNTPTCKIIFRIFHFCSNSELNLVLYILFWKVSNLPRWRRFGVNINIIFSLIIRNGCNTLSMHIIGILFIHSAWTVLSIKLCSVMNLYNRSNLIVLCSLIIRNW